MVNPLKCDYYSVSELVHFLYLNYPKEDTTTYYLVLCEEAPGEFVWEIAWGVGVVGKLQ